MMSTQNGKEKRAFTIYQERVRLRVKMRRENGRRVLIMLYYVLICEYDGYTTAEMAPIDSFIVDEKVDFFL